MFERFTERARQVVVFAQEEAREMHHTTIGTEHLLLGLIREEQGIAARVLAELGVTIPDARQFALVTNDRAEAPPSGQIPFRAEAKKVLELSLREALSLGHNYIGTEHILLGMVRPGGGASAVAGLLAGGYDRERVTDAVLLRLSGRRSREPRPQVVDPRSGSREVRAAASGAGTPLSYNDVRGGLGKVEVWHPKYPDVICGILRAYEFEGDVCVFDLSGDVVGTVRVVRTALRHGPRAPKAGPGNPTREVP